MATPGIWKGTPRPPFWRLRRFHWASCGLLLLCCAAGCRPTGSSRPATEQSDREFAPTGPLRISVVDAPELSEAIAREWRANSTEPIELHDVTSTDMTTATWDCDVVIFPTVLLGELVTKRHIAPWPAPADGPRAVAPDGDAYDWNDVFPWLRRRELQWGTDLYGVSFGSPQLLLLYRTDLFAQWNLSPPTTWADYQQRVEEIQRRIEDERPKGLRFATLEPFSEGWAARMLLARAAAYARHPNQYSTLFHLASMDPMIDRPPFRRALRELVDAVSQLPAEMRALTPDDVVARLLAGETAMAIGWPSAARSTTSAAAEEASFGIHPLPGAHEVYETATQSWQLQEDRAAQSVPLLGASGRIGALARRARSVTAARGFLVWLTRSENATRVSTRSTSTTLSRHSQLDRPQVWVDPPLQSVARQFAQAMQANQRQPLALMMPRIPAQDHYTSSLDEAVHQVAEGQIEPDAALRAVAQRWSELTDELGRDRQRSAYEASLGLQF